MGLGVGTAGVEESRVSSRTDATPGRGYRPHLDGLRAVAVYLVVLFHAGADRFSGGFIGVDVFFVLSGYLVTQLLMRDLVGGGSIRFLRFYARRMRRLLPASAVLLLVTAVVYSAIASPADVVSALGSFKAAFLYAANWYFIRQSSDYFAANINASPVIHFWSLAIEEQFYLVWPLLLGGLFAVTRSLKSRAHRVMQLTVAGAGLASVLWALSLSSTNVNRAYYGTDARAYQLLAGALLALSPGLIRRAGLRVRAVPVVAVVALSALVVLASSVLDMSVIRRGIGATVITAALIVAIEAARGGPVNRVLSWDPVVYLGKISYGTYLWHWPVILVALSLMDDKISPLSLFAISALVATGLASLSYTILERPIREQKLLDRVNPLVIGAGLTISVVCALVVIPYVLDPYQSHAATAETNATAGFTSTSNIDLKPATDDAFDVTHGIVPDMGRDLQGVGFLRSWNCLTVQSSACTIIKGTGQHVLVIGDSHAWAMFPTFAKIALDHHLTLSTSALGGCPWQRDLYDLGFDAMGRRERCMKYKNDLYKRVIPELKPDLIIAITADYLGARHAELWTSENQRVPVTDQRDLLERADADTRESLKQLESLAPKVLLVDPVPVTDAAHDPLKCLGSSAVIEACRFVMNKAPSPLERMYRAVVDQRKAFGADIDKLICPFAPICDPVVDGTVVRFDEQHLTPRFAVSLADPVYAFLREDRVLDG